MPEPDDHHPEALTRLDTELKAFETRRAGPSSPMSEAGAAGQAYRVMAGLIGGLLGGLGLGWFFDQLMHTTPFGLIGGLLIGVGVSTYAAATSAGRMSAKSAAEPSKAPGVDNADE